MAKTADLPVRRYARTSATPINSGRAPRATVTPTSFTFRASASLSKKISETTSFNLTASLTPESTKTSEITDSGETTLNATRWTTTVGGSIEHQVSPLDTLSLAAASTQVTFTGSSGNLVPYSSLSVTGAWKHLVSRRTSVTTTLGYSNYSPGGPGAAASSTYSATIGAASQLTKRLSAQVSGGLRMTNTAGGGTKLGYLADANAHLQEEDRGELAVLFGVGSPVVARRHPEHDVVGLQRQPRHQPQRPCRSGGDLQHLYLAIERDA